MNITTLIWTGLERAYMIRPVQCAWEAPCCDVVHGVHVLLQRPYFLTVAYGKWSTTLIRSAWSLPSISSPPLPPLLPTLPFVTLMTGLGSTSLCPSFLHFLLMLWYHLVDSFGRRIVVAPRNALPTRISPGEAPFFMFFNLNIYLVYFASEGELVGIHEFLDSGGNNFWDIYKCSALNFAACQGLINVV